MSVYKRVFINKHTFIKPCFNSHSILKTSNTVFLSRVWDVNRERRQLCTAVFPCRKLRDFCLQNSNLKNVGNVKMIVYLCKYWVWVKNQTCKISGKIYSAEKYWFCLGFAYSFIYYIRKRTDIIHEIFFHLVIHRKTSRQNYNCLKLEIWPLTYKRRNLSLSKYKWFNP